MATVRFTGDVLPDGSIRPPKEVHLAPGTADVTVVQREDGVAAQQPARSSLADWAEQHAEHWGQRLSAGDVSSFTGRSD